MHLFDSIGGFFSRKWSKVSQVLVSGGMNAIWTSKRYDNFAKQAYLTNVISFRCIDEISRAIESLTWLINRTDTDGNMERVTNHPVIDLMYNPNPEETFGQLTYKHTAFSLISGNAYSERITVRNGMIPRELYVHRPDRMTVLVNPLTGLRRGYRYTGPNGQYKEFEVEELTGKSDIWHARLFNPLDDWYGAGPVEPSSREIDTSNEAMEWNKNLLQNAGRPGMIFTFDGNIGETEYNRLEKKLREKYGGPKNTGKHLIVEGQNAKVTPYGFSPQEMDFIEGNRELARRVCLGFGVPPQLLGIPGDNTYSNYQEARCAFFENTVFFYSRRFAEGFSRWMFEPGSRLLLEPDYDKIPALEPRRAERWKKAQDSDFISPNEKRKLCGYEKYSKMLKDNEADEDPADKLYQNATMVPISDEEPDTAGTEQDIVDQEEEDTPDDSEDTGKPKPPKKPKK